MSSRTFEYGGNGPMIPTEQPNSGGSRQVAFVVLAALLMGTMAAAVGFTPIRELASIEAETSDAALPSGNGADHRGGRNDEDHGPPRGQVARRVLVVDLEGSRSVPGGQSSPELTDRTTNATTTAAVTDSGNDDRATCHVEHVERLLGVDVTADMAADPAAFSRLLSQPPPASIR